MVDLSPKPSEIADKESVGVTTLTLDRPDLVKYLKSSYIYWLFAAPASGSLPTPFTHKGETECVKQEGIPGQGKDNPQFTFGDHALVQHSTGIYDPSYGVGPKPDLKSWEDGGIGGIGNMPLAVFPFRGDTHFLPGACSPGFILYIAMPGETLTAIATKFGIASASALYGHPYNAAYRLLRPFPAPIQAGDQLFIPKDIASKVSILKAI